jgi:hypothetical protein
MTDHLHENKECRKEESDGMMSNSVAVCGNSGIKNLPVLKYRRHWVQLFET